MQLSKSVGIVCSSAAVLVAFPVGPVQADRPPSVAVIDVGTAQSRPISSASPTPYVIDGDTIDVAGERIRLRSDAGPIDTPELRSAKCPLELFRAQAARERLAAILAPNDFSVDRRGRDRYGRTVAVVYSEGRDVAAVLVREGHAKPWPKLSKADRPTWCSG